MSLQVEKLEKNMAKVTIEVSAEALEKLEKVKPNSIGQAMRISGVRPSDISAIMIYMRG